MMDTGLARPRKWHRPLVLTAVAMAALAVVAAIGLVVDGRQLLDQSVWAKPFKFAVAFVIYSLTLAWMIPLLQRAKRTMWTLGTLFAVTGTIDVGFIAVQAARGTYSHFNIDTDTFNVIGQQVFSSGVMALFGVNLLIAVMLLFQRVGDAALTWALRAGLMLAVLGMVVAIGIVAVASTGTRVVSDAYGNAVTLSGQHGVGVPDGGGMPITNWSTVGGDLRVPHFIGLHSVQVFLLVAVLLAAWSGRVAWLRSARTRAQLVGVVIFGYTGLFAITAWQALRGQSLVHPDAATWTAAAAVAAVTAVLAFAVVASARRRPQAARQEPLLVG